MDECVKLLSSLVVTFIMLILVISCITLYTHTSNAREVLYQTIEHLEIYGYESTETISRIEKVAQDTETTINIIPVESINNANQWRVVVTYQHNIPLIGDYKFHLEGMTRAVY